MFKFLSFLAVSVLAASSANAVVPTVSVNGQAKPAYREGEVIVKFRDGAMRSASAMNSLYASINVVDVKRYGGNFKNFEHLVLNTNQESVEQAVATLKQDPSVEYAQPNYMVYATAAKLSKPKTMGEPCWFPGIPLPPGCGDSGGSGDRPAIPSDVAQPSGAPDPDMNKAWGITKVGADQVWSVQPGSKDVLVAVIDTGIDYTHQDLAYNIWRNPNSNDTGVDPSGNGITGDVVGWDFIHNDNLPFDDNEHGTHCAGVIGAVGSDGVGISGINQRVSIMAVKFLSAEGSGDTATAIASIDYAVSRGAKVLSNSWGGRGDDSNGALKDSIDRAGQAGVLFIAAAGNDGTNNDRDFTFPASLNLDNMISVAATDNKDGLAYFSNKGANSVQVGAPGVDVYSTVPGNKYASMSGTSMACPHVAGEAALLWAQFPGASYQEIKQRIMETGDDLPALKNVTVTGKRINVANAMSRR